MFDTRLRAAEDYDLWIRLARAYGLFCVEEPLIRYLWHDGNMSRDLVKLCRETVKVLKSVPPSPSIGVTRQTIRETIARFSSRHAKTFYALAVEAFDKAEYRGAARHYRAALACDPLIGTKISWSRFANPVYRFFRPYAAVLYCALAALVADAARERLLHANG
jgi:hypothetical protein